MWIGNRNVQNPNRPFGFIMPNGMNFAKSLHNPKSVLRRILQIVWESDIPLTKREILTRAGYILNKMSGPIWTDHGNLYHVCNVSRGYLSWYFSAMNKAGFLVPLRTTGNTVWWYLGPEFPDLSQLIEIE